jgi:hypothetical protein
MQSVLVVMMDEIKSNVKVWLDDCLLHTQTEDDLLSTLNFFFKKCQEHGLKLHASKCVLFSATVIYCARLITKGGVRFDSKNMDNMSWPRPPSTTTISSTWCRRLSTRGTMNKKCFMSCWSLGASPCWRGHLRTLLGDGCGCSGHCGEVYAVSRGHRRGARDAIPLRVLMGKCCALLRMRPLSIPCAERSVVISCGKVDYDKSG